MYALNFICFLFIYENIYVYLCIYALYVCLCTCVYSSLYCMYVNVHLQLCTYVDLFMYCMCLLSFLSATLVLDVFFLFAYLIGTVGLLPVCYH